MATSVGQIGLDLVVNENGFKKQMSGVNSLAKKAGAALAAAFAVKKIADFGQQCLKLGSDLQEVQNVVDVTFPAMNKQLDSFAKNAAASFGLSETMAKRFSGTFGAMAKAFGFSEKAAYDMGTTLTGLAGDVASFYNISQDEAYTKLKSVFTGETETLKDLGVVMTQNALDAYALANGYGKMTKDMTEAEKVALRYAFVQKQLAAATGDFARTSGSWANQVRVLSLQFDSLKATIGQGLINLFTPIIRVVNTLISKLITLANAFKAFTELITGKKASSAAASTKAIADAAGSAAAGYNSAAGAATGAGKAAKKAAKEMKALMGFDQINKLQEPVTSSSGGSGGGGGGAGMDFGELAAGETVLDKTDQKMSATMKRFKELAALFSKGFKIGVGDLSVLDGIKTSIKNIGNSLKDIFTDKDIADAANRFLDSLVENIGKIAGSLASIGLTIVDNILGGIDKSLEENKDRIKQFFINLFDISGSIAEIAGNFAAAVAEIFAVFRSDTAQQITADVISIFTGAFMGTVELVGKLARDVLSALTKPFVDNKDKIKTAVQGMLDAVAPVVESIKEFVTNTFAKIGEVYDEHIAPMLQSFGEGFSEIFGSLLDGYNTYVLPVIQGLGEKFKAVMEEHIQPAVDKFIELFGKIADAIKELWEKFLQPITNWIAQNIMPLIAPAIKDIGELFLGLFATIGDIVGGISEALGGLIDFVVGVFTGDWSKAWDGIKSICSGVWSAIKGIFAPIANWFKEKFSAAKEAVTGVINKIKTTIGTVMTGIKNGIKTALDTIKEKFSTVFNAVKKTVTSIFNGIWGVIKKVINSILGGIEGMANGVVRGINKIIGVLNNLSFTTPDWLPGGLGGKKFGFDIPTMSEVQLPRLAQGGYVRKNTPQLAMIGDNRHQGEVVAPEDKLRELALEAVKMAGGGAGDAEIIVLLKQIIVLLKNMSRDVYLDGKKVTKIIKDLINQETTMTGQCPIKILP